VAQLSSGCAVACPALASMERAADRICALDPGPRCAAARAKVRDAAQRVEQACGPCRDGKPSVPKDKDTPEKAADKPALPSPSSAPAPTPPAVQSKGAEEPLGGATPPPAPPPPPAAPPAESVNAAAPRRGGCAACAVGGSGEQALGGSLLAALAVAAGVARRRSRRR
jgi:hypothetical protein